MGTHVKWLMSLLVIKLLILSKLRVTCLLEKVSSNQCSLPLVYNVPRSSLVKESKLYQKTMIYWKVSNVKVGSQHYCLFVTLKARHTIRDKVLNKTSFKEIHKVDKQNYKNKSQIWSKKLLNRRKKIKKRMNKMK